MRLLLDTHTLLWLAWGHANLSAKARTLLTDPLNELWLSMVTIWEIAIKVNLKKLNLHAPYGTFMHAAFSAYNLRLMPITVQHGEELIGLPHHHRDPFDRLLIAQAMVEQIPIISADALFDAYPVQRLW